MRKRIATVLIAVLATMTLSVGALAHNAGPCDGTDDPGHSEYAEHHIAFLAKQGGIGGPVTPGSDPLTFDGHVPGVVHQGFSACLGVH
ncbi:MAG TPA: hypothetical protein VE569_10625 [Acidimicrobiia bacterium]|nr:hypothetical protein [Acidimicrobiia bacterium]